MFTINYAELTSFIVCLAGGGNCGSCDRACLFCDVTECCKRAASLLLYGNDVVHCTASSGAVRMLRVGAAYGNDKCVHSFDSQIQTKGTTYRS
jgi:hypothetical protein